MLKEFEKDIITLAAINIAEKDTLIKDDVKF